MYLGACGALLALSAILNAKDTRMLALTFFVAVSIFVPVPRASAEQFYLFCVVMEIGVGISALALDDEGAGGWLTSICALLVIAHVLGYYLDGNPPFSPYRAIVKILEVLQVGVCVAFSPIAAPVLRNRHALPS